MAKSDIATEFCYEKVPTKEKLRGLDKEVSSNYGYGVRHVQLVIFFMCMSVSFLARGHLGVTIVAMADIDETNPEVNQLKNETHSEVIENITEFARSFGNTTEIDNATNNIKLEELIIINMTIGDANKNITENIWNIYRTYKWTKPYQEMILTSFFLGYCIMMFPIGMVCQRWGGKLPFQISLFTNGIVSILTPWAAAWGGWKAVCACRVAQGLAQAGTFPGTQFLLAKWAPSNERASFASCVYTGSTIGNVIGLQLGGLLSDSRWGWPATYWVVGILCLVAGTILTIFGAASPAESRFISEEEKFYILSRIDGGGAKSQKVPWKAILRSKHVWANIAAQVGSIVAFVFLFTQVPSFIHYTYGVDVKEIGFLSSLPYIASFFTSIAYGVISDYLTNKNMITIKTARRLSNTTSQIGFGVSMVLASFAGTSGIAVTCLVFAMGFQMGFHTGWLINHIDLSPNYSGTLMAFGNTITNLFVLLLPVAVSQIIVDVKNQHQWQIMFGMLAVLAIITNTIFVIFLSTDTQPWNDSIKDKESDVEPVTEKLEPVKEKDGNN